MGFKVKGMCRGDGKVYITATAMQGAQGVGACVTAPNGEILPCNIVKLGKNDFVIVVADFKINQNVSLASSNGTELEFKVSPFRSMCASKINGVIKKELCKASRNIDRSGMARAASLSVDSFVPTEKATLVRFRLLNYRGDNSDTEVVALDENAECIAKAKRIWCDNAEGASGDSYYSVLIPAGVEMLCLSVVDRANAPMGIFIAMKQDMIRFHLERARRRYVTAFEDEFYEGWLASKRLTEQGALAQRAVMFEKNVMFSLVVPLYKTPLNFFRDMADSTIAQTYQNWELVLVNSTPDIAELSDLVATYMRMDRRIKCINLDKNYGITENTNRGIKASKGDYICFFDHDDVLEPDILFEYATAIENADDVDLLYCDEDKLLPNGKFANPTFKPDFSLDMLRDNNYICHLLTISAKALNKVGFSDASYDGAQDHGMALKIAELGGNICHVAKILYHWRISENSTAGNSDSKPYANDAGIRVVQDHLKRLGIDADVSLSHGRNFRYSPKYAVPESCRVSVIVPTRGDGDSIERIALLARSVDLQNVEFVLVSEQTLEENTQKLPAQFGMDIKMVRPSAPFSYAAWMNEGAKRASGDVYVFMHDDVVPVHSDWLSRLVGFANRCDVGVVGTMTSDIDGVIQQAGYTFVEDKIVSLSRGFHDSWWGYIFMSLTVRDVAAVCGVCMATSRAAFEAADGFDEAYALDYADVDYCFKMKNENLKVIYTPEAEMYHTSKTNRALFKAGKSVKHYSDKAMLLTKWPQRFSQGDEFFNASFSKDVSGAELYKLEKPELGIG